VNASSVMGRSGDEMHCNRAFALHMHYFHTPDRGKESFWAGKACIWRSSYAL
jgi:hypothetical protein